MSNDGGSGPWVAGAVFCDQVIEDKQGVLTLIRVIDVVTIEVSGIGAEPPNQLPPGMINLTFVVMLKAGTSRGRCELEIDVESPDGLTKPLTSRSVTFSGAAHHGANLINKLTMGVRHEGIYWFNVKADGKLLTRAPMEIRYSRSSIPTGTLPPGG